MFGVRVKIMPPDAQFPDKVKIATELPPELLAEKKPEIAEPEGKPTVSTEAPEQIVVVQTEQKAETSAPPEATVEVPSPASPEPEKTPEEKAEEAKQ
jgi:hypothetical protein